ncbi:hypothetical protein TcWFU_009535 [Taenia crassiceps]|uniref:Uncharacterized protein n=1 Tax=Taenia crassiceps TaxID=6207 RepID=A0ABR4QBN1_9CEST
MKQTGSGSILDGRCPICFTEWNKASLQRLVLLGFGWAYLPWFRSLVTRRVRHESYRDARAVDCFVS